MITSEMEKRKKVLGVSVDAAETMGAGGDRAVKAILETILSFCEAESAKEKNAPESKPDPETEKAG